MAPVLAAAVIAAIPGTGFAVTQYHTVTEELRSGSRAFRTAGPVAVHQQLASTYRLFQAEAAVILITLAAAAGFLAVRLASRRT